jgi:hypothetical protein
MGTGVQTQVVAVFPLDTLNQTLVDVSIFANAANDVLGANSKKQYGITYQWASPRHIEFQRDITGSFDLTVDMTYTWTVKEYAPNTLKGAD